MSPHLLTLQMIFFRSISQHKYTMWPFLHACVQPLTKTFWVAFTEIGSLYVALASLKLTIFCLSARILDICHPSRLSLLFLPKITALTIVKEILNFFSFIFAQPNCMPQSHQSNLLSKLIFLQNSFLIDQIMFLNWHVKSSILQSSQP